MSDSEATAAINLTKPQIDTLLEAASAFERVILDKQMNEPMDQTMEWTVRDLWLSEASARLRAAAQELSG